ncbi:MAG: histidine phosphatase family protein [Bacilli bacterium]|nr:histidine phosphatase family protein [Bacilli bacterium]
MKIVIIRHAEPDYENDTLTTKGFREASILGEYYKNTKKDVIYSSPLPRAKYTAEALANGQEIIIKDYLEEFWHPIHIDGKQRHNWDFLPSEIERHPELITHEFLSSDIAQEADMKNLYDEVIKGFDETLKEHGYERVGSYYKVNKHNDDTIVFVCHLGMMSLLMSRLSGIPYTQIAQYFFVAPTGVTIYTSEEREKGIAQFRCREFGNIDHLKRKNEPYSKFGSFED